MSELVGAPDGDLFHVHVVLNLGEEGTGVALIVPVALDPQDDEDIDPYMDRAKAAALDMLRPFLNNKACFYAETTIPLWVNRPGAGLTNIEGDGSDRQRET